MFFLMIEVCFLKRLKRVYINVFVCMRSVVVFGMPIVVFFMRK